MQQGPILVGPARDRTGKSGLSLFSTSLKGPLQQPAAIEPVANDTSQNRECHIRGPALPAQRAVSGRPQVAVAQSPPRNTHG